MVRVRRRSGPPAGLSLACGRGLVFRSVGASADPAPIFEEPEVQLFEPSLDAGDRLAFVLRANATRTVKTGKTSSGGKERKAHLDLVMDALHPLAPEDRRARRMDLAQQVGSDWFARQGERAGFHVEDVIVSDYSVKALPRRSGRRQGQPNFGVLELTGVVTVTDAATFLAAITSGFGRAKAFGCGMMMIRRAA